MTLGQRIAQYRKAMGHFSGRAGRTARREPAGGQQMGDGRAAPDMENLLALAREFGVSVAELTETPEAGGENAPHQQKPRWLWVRHRRCTGGTVFGRLSGCWSFTAGSMSGSKMTGPL